MRLSKADGFFAIEGSEHLWFRSHYDRALGGWMVCRVDDPMTYKIMSGSTMVEPVQNQK